MSNISGLYIHVPFCISKCIYCDFYSAGIRIADWDSYINAVLNELLQRKEELTDSPDTIYLGGGTPSLIPENYLSKLIDGITNIFDNQLNIKEFTIEINPEDVSVEKLNLWRDKGINRVSIGVQSFNDKELKFLRRRHSSRQALFVIDQVSKIFENFSIDLMFGLPFQTLESWTQTLMKVKEINPPHLSSYSLMIEEKTAISLLIKQGKIRLPDEKEVIDMWDFLIEELKGQGILQYEISNYAHSGFESHHNLKYWSGNQYLGLGPGAHSYDGRNIRRFNPSDLAGYLKFYSNNFNIPGKKNKYEKFYVEEILNQQELKEEFILTRLRKKDGFLITDFCERFKEKETEILIRKIAKYKEMGLLEEEDGNIRLSQKGIQMSDYVFLQLI